MKTKFLKYCTALLFSVSSVLAMEEDKNNPQQKIPAPLFEIPALLLADMRYQKALIHLEGRLPQTNIGDALRLLNLAAKEGHADAQYQLAQLYFEGRGIPKDKDKAIKLLQLAIQQGHDVAQYELGEIYLMGKYGIPKNERQAIELFTLAAARFENAAFDLQALYASGSIVAQDSAKAEQYDMLAERLEQEHAKKN